MARAHQQLPAAGPARDMLREKGQFWTPDWVADAMVAYALGGGADHLFDPAVGAGVFFRAAKRVAGNEGRAVALLGSDIDDEPLREALANGLTGSDLANVEVRDFVLDPPSGPFPAIVANPPYIRHHRLSAQVKARLKYLGRQLLGTALDGRAGYHVYFLLRALQLLAPGGRLACIMPADTCEGVFAPTLWQWVADRYCLDAVVTFAPDATPFPGVDTNAVVFMIRHAPPDEAFCWARCEVAHTDDFRAWVASGFRHVSDAIPVVRRQTAEGIATGLSRPMRDVAAAGPALGEFAKVLRGIATGANEFFFLTSAGVARLGLPADVLVRAVGRTRDVAGDQITAEDLAALDRADRPTFLLSLDGRPRESLPPSVRAYLRQGEALGLPDRALIAMRRPWYKMEVRDAPAFLFAYLGRRHARFIANRAGVLPLTGFLCVYPKSDDPAFVDGLWRVLTHPDTIANLPLVAKSYGGGAIKVEPRALERLTLPERLVREAGLSVSRGATQPRLPLERGSDGSVRATPAADR